MPIFSRIIPTTALTIGVTLGTLCAARAAEVVVGSARVIDGDTIQVGDARVRLEGIDAPETRQSCINARGREWACGRAASRELQQILGTRQVRCEGNAKDDYGRLLGTCSIGSTDINAEMIRHGLAWAFVKYSTTYLGVEKEARQARRGVFDADNTPPWEFRAEQWKNQQGGGSADAARSCGIKGNISGKREKIYHAPGQHDYDRVRVDEKHSERWFCSEPEAERAGWRRAAR